jgi:hypothetical protein
MVTQQGRKILNLSQNWIRACSEQFKAVPAKTRGVYARYHRIVPRKR